MDLEVCYFALIDGGKIFMRIGIDIGGMSIKIGLVEEESDHIIDKKAIPTDSQSVSGLIRKNSGD